MPATARVPLGPATVNRKWWIDLNSGTYEIPVWTPVNGITDFTPGYEPSLQDDSDFTLGGVRCGHRLQVEH